MSKVAIDQELADTILQNVKEVKRLILEKKAERDDRLMRLGREAIHYSRGDSSPALYAECLSKATAMQSFVIGMTFCLIILAPGMVDQFEGD